jgi:hypothetical protein
VEATDRDDVIARLRLLLAVAVTAGLVALALGTIGDAEPRWWTPPAGTDLAMPGTWPGAWSTPSTSVPSVAGTGSAPDEVGDVEPVLAQLYAGWLAAIADRDPAALDDVVATAPFREAGVRAMDTMTVVGDPAPEAVDVVELEVLHTDDDCMAVWSVVDLSRLLGPDTRVSGVDVLWLDGDRWRFASSWRFRDDLWLDDCTRAG